MLEQVLMHLFQSTRPARGATHKADIIAILSAIISIHAPREGRDWQLVLILCFLLYFNPRAPRGARPEYWSGRIRPERISIHAPREGRDALTEEDERKVEISPHRLSTPPPPGGGRRAPVRGIAFSTYFNPRAPRGARRSKLAFVLFVLRISIHAPREGRDRVGRSSCSIFRIFQSTRPARGATFNSTAFLAWAKHFNPRAPRGARPSTHLPRI